MKLQALLSAKKSGSLTLAVTIFIFSTTVSARQAGGPNKAPDKVTQGAMVQTQEILESPIQRRALMENGADPKMQQMAITAEASARRASFGNAELKEKFYLFTSQRIIPWLVDYTKGDTREMTRLVGEFNRDPQQFVRRLPANIQYELKGIVKEAEQAQKVSGTPLDRQVPNFQQP